MACADDEGFSNVLTRGESHVLQRGHEANPLRGTVPNNDNERQRAIPRDFERFPSRVGANDAVIRTDSTDGLASLERCILGVCAKPGEI